MHNRTSFLQAEIEIGDGLPDIRSTGKCLEALKQAGFEVSRRFFLLYEIIYKRYWLSLFNSFFSIVNIGHMGERSCSGLTSSLVLAFGQKSDFI